LLNKPVQSRHRYITAIPRSVTQPYGTFCWSLLDEVVDQLYHCRQCYRLAVRVLP